MARASARVQRLADDAANVVLAQDGRVKAMPVRSCAPSPSRLGRRPTAGRPMLT